MSYSIEKMDVPSPPSPQPSQSCDVFSILDSNSNPIVESFFPPPSPALMSVNGGNEQKLLKNNKKRKKAALNTPVYPSSSSCPCSSQRVVRALNKRRSPRILMGSNLRGESDVNAVALPLGMSIAAVLSQVLEKNDTMGEEISVDDLSMVCTFAVRESLANVFGNRFEGFVRNFEKSFSSTLKTLKLINDNTCIVKGKDCSSSSTVTSPHHRKINSESTAAGIPNNNHLQEAELVNNWEQLTTVAAGLHDNLQTSYELACVIGERNQQHLACVIPSRSRLGGSSDHSILTTFERSVDEQTRANDLKAFEISLQMKNLRLQETKLSLDSDSNILERIKLSMGISKASFRAEKFKNQVQDTRHAELLKMCIDCLVAGLFIMLASLGYGTYVHSYKRIIEATASCGPPLKEPKSWWMPRQMSFFNTGLQTLGCQIQVFSRMLFGVLVIMIIAYLLVQRSATSRQGMPITFILLILGVACGFFGKVCVDTLGGNGYHWLIYWEALCLLHFFSNVCTSVLYMVLHGPVTSVTVINHWAFPYWIRRFLFYAVMLLFLPILCGLMPFATPTEWKDHAVLRLADFLESHN